MSQDELYERLQVASAVLGVLVHELRNPLHGATLLIEAMGLEGADLPTLRTKLRGQLRKFEALIGEAAGPIKDAAVEPRLASTPLGSVLMRAASALERSGDVDHVRVDLADAGEASIETDAVILARSLVELCIAVAGAPAGAGARSTVTMSLERTPEHHRILVQRDGPPLPQETRRAPFTLAGGGIHLALSRALAESVGAHVRLEHSDESGTRFTVTFRET